MDDVQNGISTVGKKEGYEQRLKSFMDSFPEFKKEMTSCHLVGKEKDLMIMFESNAPILARLLEEDVWFVIRKTPQAFIEFVDREILKGEES